MKRRHGGWTLIEALVALAIIALALLMVADATFYGMIWGREAEGKVLSTLVAQTVVDEIADHEYGESEAPADWKKIDDGWERSYDFTHYEDGNVHEVSIDARVSVADGGTGSFFGKSDNPSDLIQAEITYQLGGQTKTIQFQRTVAK